MFFPLSVALLTKDVKPRQSRVVQPGEPAQFIPAPLGGEFRVTRTAEDTLLNVKILRGRQDQRHTHVDVSGHSAGCKSKDEFMQEGDVVRLGRQCAPVCVDGGSHQDDVPAFVASCDQERIAGVQPREDLDGSDFTTLRRLAAGCRRGSLGGLRLGLGPRTGRLLRLES